MLSLLNVQAVVLGPEVSEGIVVLTPAAGRRQNASRSGVHAVAC